MVNNSPVLAQGPSSFTAPKLDSSWLPVTPVSGSVRVSLATTNITTKSNPGRERLTSADFSTQLESSIKGSQPEGRNWSRSQGGTLLIWLTQFVLLHKLGPEAPTHRELGPSTSIICQENAPRLAHRPVWWRHFLSWGSSSQMIMACVKLTKKLKLNQIAIWTKTVPNTLFWPQACTHAQTYRQIHMYTHTIKGKN